MNFENIFSPNVFVWTLPAIAARLLNTPRDRRAFVDSTNARRTRGVFSCRVRRAFVDLGTILLKSTKLEILDHDENLPSGYRDFTFAWVERLV